MRGRAVLRWGAAPHPAPRGEPSTPAGSWCAPLRSGPLISRHQRGNRNTAKKPAKADRRRPRRRKTPKNDDGGDGRRRRRRETAKRARRGAARIRRAPIWARKEKKKRMVMFGEPSEGFEPPTYCGKEKNRLRRAFRSLAAPAAGFVTSVHALETSRQPSRHF